MKFIARHAAFFASLFFILALSLSVSAQSQNALSEISQSFRKFDVVQIATASTEGVNGASKNLRFTVDGKLVEIRLVSNDLRAAGYRAENTGNDGVSILDEAPVTTFRGSVVGEEDSEVRLSIRNSKIEGYYRVGEENLFIEPASKYSKNASDFDSVIYRAEDSLNDSSFACLADVPTRIKIGDKMVAGENGRTPELLRKFDIATEADLEWVNMFGSAAAANAEILSILNMVEGTFIAQLNLRIRVTFQHTWTTGDPFASASGASGILLNFRNHWNANYQSYQRNVAHLFTAKSNSLSQGVAYLGVVCQNGAASYGLTGYVGWAPGKYLVPAHELGHNLGGQHAESGQSCGNTLMNAQLTGGTPMSFCSYSQSQINGYIATSGSCLLPVTSKRFDFDGDNRADLSVYRPNEGNWYVRRSNGGEALTNWGIHTDKPVSADFDGDGRTDVAVFRNGQWWHILSATSTVSLIYFGIAGDIPIPGNFDTDMLADLAVFRPSTGQWYWLKTTDQSMQTVNFGIDGDIPLPADFDGDNRADVNVFRPSNGAWYRINSSNGQWVTNQYGTNGDKPVLGDFDGDSRMDLAVFRPWTSEWYIIESSTGNQRHTLFGIAEDIPSVGDFDGDGRTDISVYRPSNGVWYRLNATTGQISATQYGTAGDVPIPSYYIR